MSLEKEIWELAEKLLEDDAHFIVEVKVSLTGNTSKVRILLDGDEGITIDACAGLSRALGHEMEERETMPGAYNLEVSSPGIDQPLNGVRQFRKNINRDLKVVHKNTSEVKGTLVGVDDTSVTLEIVKGKGKKKMVETMSIPFAEIEKAIVQISFK